MDISRQGKHGVWLSRPDSDGKFAVNFLLWLSSIVPFLAKAGFRFGHYFFEISVDYVSGFRSWMVPALTLLFKKLFLERATTDYMAFQNLAQQSANGWQK